MKFRAVMNEPAVMKELTSIITGLSKISKELMLRFTDDKLIIIVSKDDEGVQRPHIWCELFTSYFFNEYLMNGISKEHNEIYLALKSDMLVSALASTRRNAKMIKIKLTNRFTPCLTMEIEQPTADGLRSHLTNHDVPVQVIGRKYWHEYSFPNITNYNTTFDMPNTKSLRNCFDRLKNNKSSHLVISMNDQDCLKIKFESRVITSTIHLPDLSVAAFNGADESQKEIKARVDGRKVQNILNLLHIVAASIKCSIVNDTLVNFSHSKPHQMILHCFLTESKI